MSISNKLHGLKSLWKFDNRYQLLISRLLFRSNSLNIYRLDGMEILVDHATGDESGTDCCSHRRCISNFCHN